MGVRPMSDEIQIRRARRGDLAAIAGLVRVASSDRLQVDEAEVMDWLFSKGLWVARQGDRVVGVVAYQTENLVSVTDVFFIAPVEHLARAGKPLLETLEAEANTLMCEANVMLLPAWSPEAVRTFLEEQGYEPKPFADLHRIWREVLGGFDTEDVALLVKRLRDRMVMVPI